MRRLGLIFALAACSSATKPPAPQTGTSAGSGSAASAPAARVDVATLITADVQGVMRTPAESFPVLSYVAQLFESAPACWAKLVGSVRAAYHLGQYAKRNAYFIFDGAPPRAEVEACAREALRNFHFDVTTDGDLVVARLDDSTAYFAWRGDVLVVGSRDQVRAALDNASIELSNQWRERLASLAPAMMAIWGSDSLMAGLLEVPTQHYVLTMDGGKTPEPWFKGRVVVRYATAGDAAIAARKARTGEIAPTLSPPPEFKTAFKRMKVTQNANTLELAFDWSTFRDAGVTFDVLQQWSAHAQAIVTNPSD